MAPGSSYTIKIPNTSTEQQPKPHTIYHLLITLPLQTLALQKRYSDFLDLHSKITSQAGAAPSISPPPKTYIPSFLGGGSSNNPTLIENRRRGLEEYLQYIVSESTESRWRETPAWRAFLNLPGGASGKSSATNLSRASGSSGHAPTEVALASDPALWLDTHREVKAVLREARKHISARASTEGMTASHEENAEAKRLLIRVAGMISALERGLKSNGDEWGRERLGDGEIRRRRDLIAQTRKEKDDLEGILSKIGRKREVEAVVDNLSTKSNSASRPTLTKTAVSTGRVLGKETAKTRELDNAGVLQLQQQIMQEQDEDVDVLAAAVRRQRELATQINEELAVQNDLLGLMEEDVDRVHGKIKVASKRADKIK